MAKKMEKRWKRWKRWKKDGKDGKRWKKMDPSFLGLAPRLSSYRVLGLTAWNVVCNHGLGLHFKRGLGSGEPFCLDLPPWLWGLAPKGVGLR